jgi:hypothetical protein
MRLSSEPTRARLLLALGAALLASCATLPPAAPVPAPSLRLAPATLGTEISLQQSLTVSHAGRSQRADALLEIDQHQLHLVLLAGPKRLLTLAWDGAVLSEQRAPGLPEGLQGERFIDDIQLAYWPSTAIEAALPPGWALTDAGARRTLSFHDSTVVAIEYSTQPRWLGHIVIDRPGLGYRLSIDSITAP